MKVILNFKYFNENYNQEYADQYNFGKESVDNMKYHSGYSFKLENIKELNFKESAEYRLNGKLENGENIDALIPDVYIIECLDNDGDISSYGVSTSLLRNTHKTHNPKYNTTRYYFYIKDNVDAVEIKNVLIIAGKDMPKKLLIK